MGSIGGALVGTLDGGATGVVVGPVSFGLVLRMPVRGLFI